MAFLAGSVLAQLITAADAFAAATGILVTLGTSAPWLFHRHGADHGDRARPWLAARARDRHGRQPA